VRILRPSGALFLTATNQLCPIQVEFKYPGSLKRYFEQLALRNLLVASGFQRLDRFEMMDVERKALQRA
jgi:hypothetical protein